MNRDEGAYFLSHVINLFWCHTTTVKTQKWDVEEEKVTLKKSVAHDRQNCQVSVNLNLVLFGWKFTSIGVYPWKEESVHNVTTKLW